MLWGAAQVFTAARAVLWRLGEPVRAARGLREPLAALKVWSAAFVRIPSVSKTLVIIARRFTLLARYTEALASYTAI